MKSKVIKHSFNPGDLVFAKMKGYPFWPARIAEGNAPQNKIPIFFYGTHQTTTLVPKDIVHYWPNKQKHGKPIKRWGFEKAMWEIENDPGVCLKGQKKAAVVKRLQESRQAQQTGGVGEPRPQQTGGVGEPRPQQSGGVGEPRPLQSSEAASLTDSASPCPPPSTPTTGETPERNGPTPVKKQAPESQRRRETPAGTAGRTRDTESRTVPLSREAQSASITPVEREEASAGTTAPVTVGESLPAKKATVAKKASAAKKDVVKRNTLSKTKKAAVAKKGSARKPSRAKLKVKLPPLTTKKLSEARKSRAVEAEPGRDPQDSGRRLRGRDVSDLKENVPHSTPKSRSPPASKKRRGEDRRGEDRCVEDRRVPSRPQKNMRKRKRGEAEKEEEEESGRRECTSKLLRRDPHTPRVEEGEGPVRVEEGEGPGGGGEQE
ncbi:uncharacterized protein LOC143486708 [Brachyhypopomus gauderio]|uniref:uncharacterized protein LOC143486708 n=1 Tax=Brachyhypopomus gauderio TaxID=698409 RepID=UPI0040430061